MMRFPVGCMGGSMICESWRYLVEKWRILCRYEKGSWRRWSLVQRNEKKVNFTSRLYLDLTFCMLFGLNNFY